MTISLLSRRGLAWAVAAVLAAGASFSFAAANTGPTKVSIDENQVLVLNGKKVFPIGFTMVPKPGATTPEGKNGMQEIRDAGGLFMRTGPMGEKGGWTEAWLQEEREWQKAAAEAGMYVAPWLKEYSFLGEKNEAAKEAKLRSLIEEFKSSPAMLVWKGEDEPQWGKKPVPPMVKVADLVHKLDPDHPIWIVQAPRGTVEEMRAYDKTYDITGADIYPISYPPGVHSLEKNHDITMVGDYTRKMMQVAGGKKPVWMTLQIAWSGVAKPGRTLRFPTFAEERFMAYEAVINGARGLVFFGGQLPSTLSAEDAKYGWNWTFWNRVLKPVVEELGTQSPLAPALVAPDSKLRVKVSGEQETRTPDEKPVMHAVADAGIECLVRDAGDAVYVLACKLPGNTLKVTFSGLPKNLGEGEVMFESPRKVEAKDGSFTDWFGPYEVHVYRFKK